MKLFDSIPNDSLSRFKPVIPPVPLIEQPELSDIACFPLGFFIYASDFLLVQFVIMPSSIDSPNNIWISKVGKQEASLFLHQSFIQDEIYAPGIRDIITTVLMDE